MAFATLPKDKITEGSAIFTLMRNFGSSLFISISVMVLIRSSSINYAILSEYITPYRTGIAVPGLPDTWNPDTPGGLLRMSGEINRQATMIGYVNAFYLMALTAAVTAPLACLLKRRPREP